MKYTIRVFNPTKNNIKFTDKGTMKSVVLHPLTQLDTEGVKEDLEYYRKCGLNIFYGEKVVKRVPPKRVKKVPLVEKPEEPLGGE